jgi:tRNA threonylcarbamoyl adenosine modification protein YeaZ
MLFLAIDTAGSACSAALARREKDAAAIVAARSETIKRGHSERLLPVMEAVLAEAGAVYDDLEGIAVTIGPGSFVGVRVGVAAARGLALALGAPAVGIGSLDALAARAASGRSEGTAVALIGTTRGQTFALARDIASGAALIAPTVASHDRVAAALAGASLPLLLNGSGAAEAAARLPGGAFEVLGGEDHPHIADVANMAFFGGPKQPPSPLYLRGADAKPQTAAVALA